MIVLFKVPSHGTPNRGILTVVESKELFRVRRVFWITDISQGAQRGGHAHKELKQFICAIGGKVRIISIDRNGNKQTVYLLSQNQGVFVPPWNWLDISFMTKNCTLLVLASDTYKESDYIRDFDEFKAGGSVQRS